jgi:hypothetical protein
LRQRRRNIIARSLNHIRIARKSKRDGPPDEAFRSWSTPNRWLWTKLHDTALALACLGLVWFAITWNLMNFNMHY